MGLRLTDAREAVKRHGLFQEAGFETAIVGGQSCVVGVYVSAETASARFDAVRDLACEVLGTSSPNVRRTGAGQVLLTHPIVDEYDADYAAAIRVPGQASGQADAA